MVEYPKDVDFVVLPYSCIYTPFTFEEWQRKRDERSQTKAENSGSAFVAHGPTAKDLEALRKYIEGIWYWGDSLSRDTEIAKLPFILEDVGLVFGSFESWADDSAIDFELLGGQPDEVRNLLERWPDYKKILLPVFQWSQDVVDSYVDAVWRMFERAQKRAGASEGVSLQRSLGLWNLAWELFGCRKSRNRFIIRYENLRRELAVGALMRFTVEKIGPDQKAVVEMLRNATSDRERCRAAGKWDSDRAAKNAQFREFLNSEKRPEVWRVDTVRAIFRAIIGRRVADGLTVPDGLGYNATSDLDSTGALFKKVRRCVYRLKN